ncbi:hypothetical protein [Saccharospirillum impatiens]|uniref:hypothetical protein n=1 Tax=Saccharospirillum impatiens TaxID=169438 RepID=UPI0003F704B6|nr:hypothetical protein [Saccharospirillum impatiens]
MKGSTLLTLTLVTLAITALYVVLGQPEVTPGYLMKNPVGAESGVHQSLTWIDQIQQTLASWL